MLPCMLPCTLPSHSADMAQMHVHTCNVSWLEMQSSCCCGPPHLAVAVADHLPHVQLQVAQPLRQALDVALAGRRWVRVGLWVAVSGVGTAWLCLAGCMLRSGAVTMHSASQAHGGCRRQRC